MRDGTCPFFAETEKTKCRCEGGILKFPDKQTRDEWLDEYCCSTSLGENCQLYKMLMAAYGRKYSSEGIDHETVNR